MSCQQTIRCQKKRLGWPLGTSYMAWNTVRTIHISTYLLAESCVMQRSHSVFFSAFDLFFLSFANKNFVKSHTDRALPKKWVLWLPKYFIFCDAAASFLTQHYTLTWNYFWSHTVRFYYFWKTFIEKLLVLNLNTDYKKRLVRIHMRQ